MELNIKRDEVAIALYDFSLELDRLLLSHGHLRQMVSSYQSVLTNTDHSTANTADYITAVCAIGTYNQLSLSLAHLQTSMSQAHVTELVQIGREFTSEEF